MIFSSRSAVSGSPPDRKRAIVCGTTSKPRACELGGRPNKQEERLSRKRGRAAQAPVAESRPGKFHIEKLLICWVLVPEVCCTHCTKYQLRCIQGTQKWFLSNGRLCKVLPTTEPSLKWSSLEPITEAEAAMILLTIRSSQRSLLADTNILFGPRQPIPVSCPKGN
jgi:hypothetical protein